MSQVKFFRQAETEITQQNDNLPSGDNDDYATTFQRAEAVQQALQQARHKSRIRTAIAFAVFVVVFTALCYGSRFFITVVTVSGQSMVPSYRPGELVLVKNMRLVDELQYGDIIVFQNENTHNTLFVKRLVGMPGDTLRIAGGDLYRNDQRIEEDVVKTLPEHYGILSEPVVLGENEYFAMGDNRNNSHDCRAFGPIQEEDIQYLVLTAPWKVAQ